VTPIKDKTKSAEPAVDANSVLFGSIEEMKSQEEHHSFRSKLNVLKFAKKQGGIENVEEKKLLPFTDYKSANM
jgi:hypothetical protein